CFAITPDMSALTGGADKTGTREGGTVKDAHGLVSTPGKKRSIAAVSARRADFYHANKDAGERFAARLLQGCEELADLKERAGKKESGAEDRYKAVLKMTQEIYGEKDIPKLDDADGLIADAVFVGQPGNKSFFTDSGNLSGFEAKQRAALNL